MPKGLKIRTLKITLKKTLKSLGKDSLFMAYLIVRALTFRAVHGVKKMGEIQNENQDLILDLNLEQKLNNQLQLQIFMN